MVQRSWNWAETAWLAEGHKAPLYCCAFNHFARSGGDLLATVGSSRASVYSCVADGSLHCVHAFQDVDPEEDYYACAWSVDTDTGAPLLLVAGKNALLQAVNCATGWLDGTFEGHGQCINDIAVHPTRPNLVVTASKDSSLRLWNLRSRVCVLIFQGDGGHRNEVLSVDWQPGGELTLVSAGMDSCIKVWSLGAYKATLDHSDHWSGSSGGGDSGSGGNSGGAAFPTRHVTVPAFSTRAVHWNYVDCVRWLGAFVLSKSVDNCIVCWQPDPAAGPGTATIEGGAVGLGVGECERGSWRGREGAVKFVQEFQLEDCKDVWWVRFALDYWCQVLAVGTATGRVLVFDPHMLGSAAKARLEPRRAAGKNDATLLVRQTAVSFDGSIIVACHEDGSITRFDAVDLEAAPQQQQQHDTAPPVRTALQAAFEEVLSALAEVLEESGSRPVRE